MSMHPEMLKRVNEAKLALMDMEGITFFSSLLCFLQIVMEEGCETAWTNGIQMGFDPEFVRKCNTNELVWTIMHELGHVIYNHTEICWANKLDPEIHNWAGDHYINLWLPTVGFSEHPHFIKILADPKYTGWSTQEIYEDLKKEQKKGNTPPPPPAGGGGLGLDIRIPKGMTPSQHKEEMTGILIQATMEADRKKDFGSVPGSVRRFVEEAISPQLPWQEILMNHMSAYARNDYSMHRPNRRYMPSFYMPSMQSEAMGHMISAKDVSGSISKHELDEISAEEKYVWDLLEPESMRFITFDTKIHMNEVVHKGSSLPDPVLEGGGGTNVRPVLQYIREEDPVLALIFTDGHFGMPNLDEITADIYWVIKGNPNFNPPKGTVIHID